MGSSMRRVVHEPGYVLHHHDWSETSVIVEAFTRSHGRMALVARGAKRPSSNFRPVLLPLQPLLLTWSGKGEIRSLRGVEWGGGGVMPRGEALLAGYYANELLMRLLAREDAHTRLFDGYAALAHTLATRETAEARTAAALRAFELLLLRESGHLPALDVETLVVAPLHDARRYVLSVEGGIGVAGPDDTSWLTGSQWRQLDQALTGQAPFVVALDAVAGMPAAARTRLRHQLRALLHYHCGGGQLRTRELMLELRRLLPVHLP